MKSAVNHVDGFLMKFLISYKLYSHREQPRISALEIVNLIVNIRIFLFSSFFFMKHPLNSREWHGTLFFWTVDAHSNPSVNFFSRKPRNNNYLGTNLCGLEIYLWSGPFKAITVNRQKTTDNTHVVNGIGNQTLQCLLPYSGLAVIAHLKDANDEVPSPNHTSFLPLRDFRVLEKTRKWILVKKRARKFNARNLYHVISKKTMYELCMLSATGLLVVLEDTSIWSCFRPFNFPPIWFLVVVVF